MAGSAAYAGRGAGAGTRPVRYLRDLYFFRCGFSALWVALVFTLASAGTAGGTVSFLGGLLLVVYPVSDAAATAFDLRRAAAGWPQLVNLGSDLVAAVAIGIAARSGLAAAITAFGGWAVLSGAGSVFAGISFAGWTGALWLRGRFTPGVAAGERAAR